ncbi:MAG: hypothetical protein KF900_09590 [Bacteroidetes bacterium]|nr:hypothetical protein [Bacteroidota bacterium]
MKTNIMKYILTIISLTLIWSSCSKDKAAKTFERDKNIYIALTNGKEKQLTFNQSDSDPILVADKRYVVFVRSQGSRYNHQTKKIMKVNIDDLAESIITDQKPYKDEWGKQMYQVQSLTLSLDKKFILFTTEKYATGSQMVKVNLDNGEWTEMFSAEVFEIIDKGKYKGYFLAGQSTIEDYGRDIYYRLLNDSGRIIKKFSDEESMRAFKNELK